jgi:L-lactate dehydrogenase complex protein LldG
MSSRDDILARVRAAIDGSRAEPVPRPYRRAGRLPADARVERFCERVGEYRAEVNRVPAGEVGGAVFRALERRGARTVVVPPALPPDWHPAGLEIVADTNLSARDLDALDGVVTGCTVGIAETGTIVLTGAEHEGRRALTLVPDLHVCVIDERQIVELVPEAMDILWTIAGAARRPVTFVSGPSATSDIELSRVEGVHGPRDLVVLVVSPPLPTAP